MHTAILSGPPTEDARSGGGVTEGSCRFVQGAVQSQHAGRAWPSLCRSRGGERPVVRLGPRWAERADIDNLGHNLHAVDQVGLCFTIAGGDGDVQRLMSS